VLEGLVRAKQDLLDKDGEQAFSVVPMMLHGDAAFAGQGVVAETLNLANLPATASAAPSTSSSTTRSASPRAGVLQVQRVLHRRRQMIGAPIFHVNGDDPEACVWWRGWPWTSGSGSARTSSSTCCATASAATTRATTRR